MSESEEQKGSAPARVVALGVFLILFGLVFGVLTVATIVGPVFGLIMLGFGIFLLRKSIQGRPPETLP